MRSQARAHQPPPLSLSVASSGGTHALELLDQHARESLEATTRSLISFAAAIPRAKLAAMRASHSPSRSTGVHALLHSIRRTCRWGCRSCQWAQPWWRRCTSAVRTVTSVVGSVIAVPFTAQQQSMGRGLRQTLNPSRAWHLVVAPAPVAPRVFRGLGRRTGLGPLRPATGTSASAAPRTPIMIAITGISAALPHRDRLVTSSMASTPCVRSNEDNPKR